MKGFVEDIEALTLGNTDFRRVLYTTKELQLVLMAIQPGNEIGEEIHDDVTQFFRFEAGEGEVWIDGVCHKVAGDDGVIVPAFSAAKHSVGVITPGQLCIPRALVAAITSASQLGDTIRRPPASATSATGSGECGSAASRTACCSLVSVPRWKAA